MSLCSREDGWLPRHMFKVGWVGHCVQEKVGGYQESCLKKSGRAVKKNCTAVLGFQEMNYDSFARPPNPYIQLMMIVLYL